MRLRTLCALVVSTLALAGTAFAAPPKPSGPVVLLGASVVQFWADERPGFFAAHPGYLDKGRAGEPLSTTVQRLSREILPLKPRVLVMITGGAGTPERTVHDLSRLVGLGRRSGARMVLAASPSVQADNLAAIRDYARREGLGYADFADMRGPDGQVKAGLTYDGVHPTASGYTLMEPVLTAALDRVLSAP